MASRAVPAICPCWAKAAAGSSSVLAALLTISLLGLGPYDSVSLGTILNDAIKSEALLDGAWWAFFPPMILVTVIAFSLYVVNTAMEGVFNPRLRK